MNQDHTPLLRLHRRQFVIGPQPFQADEDWVSRPLGSSTWVSCCPDLRTTWTRDADGNAWGLLGLAVETSDAAPDPSAQIMRTRSADVPDLYAGWAGRWVLLGQGQVHLDAAGLLGCFYGTAREGRTWASSSPALLARLLASGAPLEADPRRLYHALGISWYTPPRSRLAGVRRLLPSQILDVAAGRVLPRPLMPPIDPTRGYDATLELLRRYLATAMRRLPATQHPPWLGLTGGYDARLLLAIAHAEGVAVAPFTRIAARMSAADRFLPPRLAHELGYAHVFVRGGRRRPGRRRLVAEHCAGHVSDGDAEPLLTGARDGLGGIAFGGHGFALASGYWKLRALPETVADPDAGTRQLAALFREPLDSTAMAGLREWLGWVCTYPQEHLDWRDRFFLEQRQAGWLSSKEQMYDLARLERFPILNAARTYALLLGLDDHQRLGSKIQEALIRRTAPALLRYPFNPPDRYFGLLKVAAFRARHPVYPFRKLTSRIEKWWMT